jgi:outer membrane protein assembly factor BamB
MSPHLGELAVRSSSRTTASTAHKRIATSVSGSRGFWRLACGLALLGACALSVRGGDLASSATAPLAQHILAATGIQGGLVVHLGCGDGQLTAALHASDRYLVHGLDTDPQQIAAARRNIQALGLYGRVSVDAWDGAELPYVENLVNLVVAENLGGLAMDEVLRVLVPRGVAYIKTKDGWTKTIKPWPAEIDEWTHFLHGPDNNAVARDTQVAPPRRMQWCCEPLWSRSHAFTSSFGAMVSAQGRVFYIVDEGPTGIAQEAVPEKWTLIARDAFNGVLLWKRPLTPWGAMAWKNSALRATPRSVPRCLVAENDRLFATLGYGAAVSILDAATGAELAMCEGTEAAQDIRCVQGILLVDKGGTQLIALDARSGHRLWTVDTKVRPLSLATHGPRVFYQDQGQQALVCRKIADGKSVWQVPSPQFVAVVVHDDRVLLASGSELKAIAAETGESLWSVKQSVPRGEMFVAQQAIWYWAGEDIVARDLATGQPTTKIDTADVFSAGHHHRCYPSKATENYFVTQNRGAEFISLTGGAHTQNDWIRGACSYGIMPCNGLLYVPPHPCFCYPGVKLTGFNALAPQRSTRPRTDPDQGRLARGPAYEAGLAEVATPDPGADWPTYRHDPTRSGATAGEVSPRLIPLWQAALHGPLTPPVVSGRRVYVAAKDEHTLHALDAESGRRLWQFTAGGRIDSPPSIDGPRVLFGCTDGYAYCLRAADGALAWRFRAAPENRRILAQGQLESPWRVHGSILLIDGMAYLTAGRSSFLDDGIWIFGLDPRSGQVRCQTRLDTWLPLRDDARGKPFFPAFHIEGAMSDILVSQGGSLYLGQFQFDAQLVRQEVPYLMPAPAPKPAPAAKPSPADAAQIPRKQTPEFRDNPFTWYMEHSHPGLVAQYEKAFGGLTFGERYMGLHVVAMSGFLDDSSFNRTYWTYSTVRPGSDYNHVDRDPRSGELLVTAPDRTYVVRSHPENAATNTFMPGQKGYLLAAVANPSTSVGEDGLVNVSRRTASKAKVPPPLWSDWVPLRIRSMVLAGKTLFACGVPDVVDPADPLAALEGRKGAGLRAYNAADGQKLAEYQVDSPPVFDGLTAAAGRLYWSAIDGTLVCMGSVSSDAADAGAAPQIEAAKE